MPNKVNFVNIPQELKANASFCLWKLEKRSGRPTKVPYNPKTGALARTNDPSTFSDFGTAMTAYAMGGWDGIGYRVSEGIGAIDIDHCIREDGSLNDVAASIMAFFPDSYFEKSPSGTGLRGFFRLSPDFAYDKTVYYINNRKHGLEVYLPGMTNRFVTVTGDVYKPGTVTRNDEALQNCLDTFMRRSNRMVGKAIEPCSYLNDEQVIEHASRSESGDKFKALYEGRWEEGYDSQSDADMAFVSMLAFWCGNVEEQIDRIFRTSGLMRDKWDRMTGDATYGQITIRNAIASGSAIYVPIGDTDSAEADFEDLDEAGAEEEHAAFSPDLNHLTRTLEEMKPQSNPRYQKDEIGMGNIFADYFKPNDKISRGEVATLLWNMAGKPKAKSGYKKFPDVSYSKYYGPAIKWASSVGIINGYSSGSKKGKFGPDDNVRRQDLAVMFAAYAEYWEGKSVTGSASNYSSMKDKAKVSSYARRQMGWCFKNKILTGTSDGYILPKNNATRAEAAKMAVVLYDIVY